MEIAGGADLGDPSLGHVRFGMLNTYFILHVLRQIIQTGR